MRWFRRFKNFDFNLKDKERPGQPKKCEDVEWQALLDKNDTQIQQKMEKGLNVGHRTIFDRLHAMGKIQKARKWVPYQLYDKQIVKRKTVFEVLLSGIKNRIALGRR